MGWVCSSFEAAEEEEAVCVKAAFLPHLGAHPLAQRETQTLGLQFLSGNEVLGRGGAITMPVTAVFRWGSQGVWPYRKEEIVSCFSGWL